MPKVNITVAGVDKRLTGLCPSKASGSDHISPCVLKELHTEVAAILSEIFRFSFHTGIVPLDWKNAVIAPVYKK